MKNISPPVQGDSRRELVRRHYNTRWVRPAALLFPIVLLCGMVISRSLSERATKDVFFSLMLAGYMAVFLSVWPLRELPRVVALGLAFAGLQWIALKSPPRVVPFFALLDLNGVLILAARRILFDGNDRRL